MITLIKTFTKVSSMLVIASVDRCPKGFDFDPKGLIKAGYTQA